MKCNTVLAAAIALAIVIALAMLGRAGAAEPGRARLAVYGTQRDTADVIVIAAPGMRHAKLNDPQYVQLRAYYPGFKGPKSHGPAIAIYAVGLQQLECAGDLDRVTQSGRGTFIVSRYGYISCGFTGHARSVALMPLDLAPPLRGYIAQRIVNLTLP